MSEFELKASVERLARSVDFGIKRELADQICRNVEIFAAREIAAAREALFADCWCFSRKPSLASAP